MNHEMAMRLRDDRIAAHPALDGLLPRWRKELVGQVVQACKHFTLPKIVDSIADCIIDSFRREHAICMSLCKILPIS